jgi:RNA polymerase sigma-70 factor (ECF subfamily)
MQPAFGTYVSGRPAGLFVLTVAGPRIRAITRFHVDALFPRFGLPG